MIAQDDLPSRSGSERLRTDGGGRADDDDRSASHVKTPDPSDCYGPALSQSTLGREDAERVADLFKVLGDPTRVLILQALIQGQELCVHELADAVGMSQSSVSHHLRLLRTFDLIRARRSGREVYYRPDDDHVEQLIGVCVEHVAHARGARGGRHG